MQFRTELPVLLFEAAMIEEVTEEAENLLFGEGFGKIAAAAKGLDLMCDGTKGYRYGQKESSKLRAGVL